MTKRMRFNRMRLRTRWDALSRDRCHSNTLTLTLAVNKSGTMSRSYRRTILWPDVAHISRLAQQSVTENPQIYAHFAYSFQA